MYSIVTLFCLFFSVSVPALLNILAYPLNKSWSVRISDYIVNVLAPRVFAILSSYRHFSFIQYKENFDSLPRQFVLVSNHQSLFDIPCYMVFFKGRDVRFVAKDELSRHVPLVSEMLRAHEHCMIPRKASAVTAMRVMEKFSRQALEKNQIPVLFPEGTRTKDGNVGKFYSAGFRKLVEGTGLPVVVCALDGGWQIGNLGAIIRNLKNGRYRVKVVGVFDPPKTKEEQSKILEEARRRIQAQLDEWRAADA